MTIADLDVVGFSQGLIQYFFPLVTGISEQEVKSDRRFLRLNHLERLRESGKNHVRSDYGLVRGIGEDGGRHALITLRQELLVRYCPYYQIKKLAVIGGFIRLHLE